ncbi:SPW repeat protein [Chryseosolibacter indicus]|uniref:SPW repeat protein n=1 Tax=Chryseosolibacter indicus TaxID=2782351 RepID=A0ABS5VRC5_9BACT|nr:SPW repeat protein [Chryseosolibacter indicus]MBT1703342.1 SPW repeat protein [Chryseosolibacter indicus]
MKVIPTRVHGVLDYLVGIFLIAAPWLLGFAGNGAETWVPVILGIGAILYSLMTNYELGASKMLSMRTHLNMDLLSGAFLAISPWLFGFNEYVYLPHLLLGIMEIGVALLTDPVPAHATNNSVLTDRQHRHAH